MDSSSETAVTDQIVIGVFWPIHVLRKVEGRNFDVSEKLIIFNNQKGIIRDAKHGQHIGRYALHEKITVGVSKRCRSEGPVEVQERTSSRQRVMTQGGSAAAASSSPSAPGAPVN